MRTLFSILILALAITSTPAAKADANNPWGGGCVSYEPNVDGSICVPSAAHVCTCKLNAHGSAVLPSLVIDLKTGQMAAGIDVVPAGFCYGMTYKPTQWYASGADICVQTRLASSLPNQVGFALMLNAADYASFGFGTMGTQVKGSLVWHGMVYFSPRLPIQ